MLNEPEPDNFELPPELSELENRLLNLPKTKTSSLDRDDLMFRAGYAAAMAERELSPARSKHVASRWGWPVLSGTLATITAGLAIALWAPVDVGEDSKMAKTPEVSDSHLVVDANHSEPNDNVTIDSSGKSTESPLAVVNPIERTIGSYFEKMVVRNPSPLSIFAMSRNLLRSVEHTETDRPRVRGVSKRPQMEPLKVNRYRNTKLWEQL